VKPIPVPPPTSGPTKSSSRNNVPFLGTGFGVTCSGTTTNKAGTIRVMIPGTDTVFTPPYSYTLDAAAQVPNLVTNWAGAGKITIPWWLASISRRGRFGYIEPAAAYDIYDIRLTRYVRNIEGS
jgi:hypothetical protein